MKPTSEHGGKCQLNGAEAALPHGLGTRSGGDAMLSSPDGDRHRAAPRPDTRLEIVGASPGRTARRTQWYPARTLTTAARRSRRSHRWLGEHQPAPNGRPLRKSSAGTATARRWRSSWEGWDPRPAVGVSARVADSPSTVSARFSSQPFRHGDTIIHRELRTSPCAHAPRRTGK